MAQLLTLEGDSPQTEIPFHELAGEMAGLVPEGFLAGELAGAIPEGYEPEEIHGTFYPTHDDDDNLYGDIVFTHVTARAPGLHGELGKFGFGKAFKAKGFKIGKKFTPKKLFNASLKPLKVGLKIGKGIFKGIGKGLKGIGKGFKMKGPKGGGGMDMMQQIMDMQAQQQAAAAEQAVPRYEEPPIEEEPVEPAPAPQVQYYPPTTTYSPQPVSQWGPAYSAYNSEEDSGMDDFSYDQEEEVAAMYGDAWFNHADQLAGELGFSLFKKKKSNKTKMLAMNLIAASSGNPQLAQMAALANISQAKRNQAKRKKAKALTKKIVGGVGLVAAGIATGGLAAIPSLVSSIGSTGLGALSSALGPAMSAIGPIAKTIGVTGLDKFAGLMGPGGIGQLTSILGEGGFGQVLEMLGPEASKLATPEGAQSIVEALTSGQVQGPDDMMSFLQSHLNSLVQPPQEQATVTSTPNGDVVTFKPTVNRRELEVSGPGLKLGNNTVLIVLAVGAGLYMWKNKGKA